MFRLTSSFCRCISSEMAGGNFSTLLLSRYRAVKWFHRNNAGLKFRMPLSRTNSLMYISRPASSWLWKNKKLRKKFVKLSRFVLISKQWHFDEFLNTFNFVKKNSWKHHVCFDFYYITLTIWRIFFKSKTNVTLQRNLATWRIFSNLLLSSLGIHIFLPGRAFLTRHNCRVKSWLWSL